MNRRDAVLGLLDREARPAYVPAGFFIHFPEAFHHGQAAVEKHLEYFEHTGMDIVKIQLEAKFPSRPEIRTPADWARVPFPDLDFYRDPLDILAGILAAAKGEALVVQTLYSPFMQARFSTSRELLMRHLEEDPGAVRAGMERITESLLGFVRACIELGVDGFYASTQGGDRAMFGRSPRFAECIAPYDLALMREMDRACPFNILHICDFHGDYDDLSPFLDYPGHVVSTPHHVRHPGTGEEQPIDVFDRPLMGGLDRHGVIATGPEAAIVAEVKRVLAAAPPRFFLGADCTLPDTVSWDHIRCAVAAAHEGR